MVGRYVVVLLVCRCSSPSGGGYPWGLLVAPRRGLPRTTSATVVGLARGLA